MALPPDMIPIGHPSAPQFPSDMIPIGQPSASQFPSDMIPVQSQGLGKGTGNLRHFQAVGQSGSIVVAFMGHEHLKSTAKYEHMWGIGRHLLGSQVYDYWADPYMRVHEHWADTDRLNIQNGGNLVSAEEGFRSQWGDRPPEKFIGHVSP